MVSDQKASLGGTPPGSGSAAYSRAAHSACDPRHPQTPSSTPPLLHSKKPASCGLFFRAIEGFRARREIGWLVGERSRSGGSFWNAIGECGYA